MTLAIVDRLGAVHRVFGTGMTCPTATRAPRRVPVTPNQCLVYSLGPCGACWPRNEEFTRIVQRRATS